MRKDPPFDMEYIYTTYILELAERRGLLVVNKPSSLRDINEKAYTAWFQQCTAAEPRNTVAQTSCSVSWRSTAGSCSNRSTAWAGRSIFVVRRGRPERQT